MSSIFIILSFLMAIIFNKVYLIFHLTRLMINLFVIILLVNFTLSKHPFILNLKHCKFLKTIACLLNFGYILLFFAELSYNQNYYLSLPLILFEIEISVFIILFSSTIAVSRLIEYFKDMEKSTLIVLGCRLDENGNCTTMLKRRLNKVIKLFNRANVKPKIILSGGSPHSKIDECIGMYNYLTNKKIPSSVLYLDHNSKNTLENFENSIKIVKKNNLNRNLYFITSDFHVPRAKIYAKTLRIKIVSIGVSSPINKYISRCISEMITIIIIKAKTFLFIYIILFLFMVIIKPY